MTQETPITEKDAGTDAVFCDDCNAAVRLERDGDGLTLRCACGKQRTINAIATLPEGWRE